MLSGPSDRPGGKPDSLVILCHGYGSNGEDLINLAREWRPKLPKTLFLAPNAPERSPHPGGYQWFPISSFSPEERTAGTYKAAPLLDAFIDHALKENGIPPAKLALAGFSQGTMLALHAGLRRKDPVAGILGYSGALAAPEKLIAEIKNRPPVFLAHGGRDDLIPFPAMFEAKGALRAAGVPVETHFSPNVGHGIDREGVAKGGEFLAKVLA